MKASIRDRFLATCRFEKPDNPIRFEAMGVWPETVNRWRNEGLPFYVFNDLAAIPYFRFETWLPMLFGDHRNPGFFPAFVPRVIKKEGSTRIVRDFSGKTFREFKDGSASIPQHIEDPVHCRDDFRRLRWRLDPDIPGRVNNPMIDGAIAGAKLMSMPHAAQFSGLFGFHRHLLGVERLMTTYFDDPELLRSMAKAWAKLCSGVIHRVSKKAKIDLVVFWEDMCFRNGPLISPKMFRKFMSPYYKQVIEEAKEHGIENFWVDTDGDCSLIIPLFEEAGVTGMFPFEVQAGMDVREVRKNHPNLVIWGGVDKRRLAEGKPAIEDEINERVAPMLAGGGYIPCTDHLVPPDVSLENFRYYLNLMRS